MNDMASACDIGCDEYGYPIRSPDWMYKSMMRGVSSLPPETGQWFSHGWGMQFVPYGPDTAPLPRVRGPNEMVERVAAVIRTEAGKMNRQISGAEAIVLAIASIAAMREPTEAMVDVGMDNGSFPMCNMEVEFRYQTMIDAALDATPRR